MCYFLYFNCYSCYRNGLNLQLLWMPGKTEIVSNWQRRPVKFIHLIWFIIWILTGGGQWSSRQLWGGKEKLTIWMLQVVLINTKCPFRQMIVGQSKRHNQKSVLNFLNWKKLSFVFWKKIKIRIDKWNSESRCVVWSKGFI